MAEEAEAEAPDPFINLVRGNDVDFQVRFMVVHERTTIMLQAQQFRNEFRNEVTNGGNRLHGNGRVLIHNLMSDDESDDVALLRPNVRQHLTDLFAVEHCLNDVDTVEDVGVIINVLGDGHCLHRAFMAGLFDYAVAPLYLFGQGYGDDGASARLAHYENLSNNFMSSWRERTRRHLEANQSLFVSSNDKIRDVSFSDHTRCTWIETQRRTSNVKAEFLDRIWNADTNFNRPVGDRYWNGNAVILVLCHFWRRTVVHYSSPPNAGRHCFIAYWCNKICKLRVHIFGARWVTPPEGAICLHHDGSHYRYISTIRRDPSLQSLYDTIQRNFKQGHVLTLPYSDIRELSGTKIVLWWRQKQFEARCKARCVCATPVPSTAAAASQSVQDHTEYQDDIPSLPCVYGQSGEESLDIDILGKPPFHHDEENHWGSFLPPLDRKTSPQTEVLIGNAGLGFGLVNERSEPHQDSDQLYSFLQSNTWGIKGSVDEFFNWLLGEDIDSMASLKLAVSDNVNYLTEMMQGSGSCGLKKFTINAFVAAINDHKVKQPSAFADDSTIHKLKPAFVSKQPQLKAPPESLLKPPPESLLKPPPESLLKHPPELLLKHPPELLLKPPPESLLKATESQRKPPPGELLVKPSAAEKHLKTQHGTLQMSMCHNAEPDCEIPASTPLSKKIFSTSNLNKISSSPVMSRYPMFEKIVHQGQEEYWEFRPFDNEEEIVFDVDQKELVGRIHTTQINNTLTSVTFTSAFNKEGPGEWFHDRLYSVEHRNLRHVSFRSTTAITLKVPSQQQASSGFTLKLLTRSFH